MISERIEAVRSMLQSSQPLTLVVLSTLRHVILRAPQPVRLFFSFLSLFLCFFVSFYLLCVCVCVFVCFKALNSLFSFSFLAPFYFTLMGNPITLATAIVNIFHMLPIAQGRFRVDAWRDFSPEDSSCRRGECGTEGLLEEGGLHLANTRTRCSWCAHRARNGASGARCPHPSSTCSSFQRHEPYKSTTLSVHSFWINVIINFHTSAYTLYPP